MGNQQFAKEEPMNIRNWLWAALLISCTCLTARAQPAEPNNYVIRARIVGPDGAPVVGAVAEPDGVSTGTSTGWGGSQGFTNRVVADTNGMIQIGRAQPFTRLQLKIHAPGLATDHSWYEVTNTVHTINMG